MNCYDESKCQESVVKWYRLSKLFKCGNSIIHVHHVKHFILTVSMWLKLQLFNGVNQCLGEIVGFNNLILFSCCKLPSKHEVLNLIDRN